MSMKAFERLLFAIIIGVLSTRNALAQTPSPAGTATPSMTAIDGWVQVSVLSESVKKPPSAFSQEEALALLDQYDFSTFLATDPWFGNSTTPVDFQAVLVPSADVSRVKADLHAWTTRLVVQAGTEPGEASFGPRAFQLWSIEDRIRQLCHAGLERKLLSMSASEMTYESRFSNCPQNVPSRLGGTFGLGPDRVVLTRAVITEKSLSSGTKIVNLSYEVKGSEFTPSQREEGMKLISDARFAALAPSGSG
jgi:hypothetical protein